MMIVTLLLAVIFGAMFHVTKDSMERQTMQMLQLLREYPGMPTPKIEKERIPHVVAHISRQGEVDVVSNTLFDEENLDDLLTLIKTVYEGKEQEGILEEWDLRYGKFPMPRGEEIVFVDTTIETRAMRTLLHTSGVIGFAGFCLFLGVSILLAQWAVKPVEEAWKLQKQFVADASHELKTPLTVIMTNAELIQDEGYDEPQKRQFSKSIYAMSCQMRGLVESLLDLARVDNGIVKKKFRALDLYNLVSECLLPFEPIFFEKGMELSCCLEEGIHVRGSDIHLRQILDILLDNASKYASPDSKVTVTLEKQGRYCILSVDNLGEHLSREELKNVFKRFYRIDKARSMNQSYGLGLSIAQSIVSEHRGKIWAESQNGVNTFRVLLPIIRTGFERKEK